MHFNILFRFLDVLTRTVHIWASCCNCCPFVICSCWYVEFFHTVQSANQIVSLSTLLQPSFFLSDLNNNFLKYITPLSLQPTLLVTLALFLINTLLSQISALSKSCY